MVSKRKNLLDVGLQPDIIYPKFIGFRREDGQDDDPLRLLFLEA